MQVLHVTAILDNLYKIMRKETNISTDCFNVKLPNEDGMLAQENNAC